MDRLLKNVKIVIQLLKGKHYDNIRVYTNDIQNDVESAMATVSKIKNAKSESAQEKIVDEMNKLIDSQKALAKRMNAEL